MVHVTHRIVSTEAGKEARAMTPISGKSVQKPENG